MPKDFFDPHQSQKNGELLNGAFEEKTEPLHHEYSVLEIRFNSLQRQARNLAERITAIQIDQAAAQDSTLIKHEGEEFRKDIQYLQDLYNLNISKQEVTEDKLKQLDEDLQKLALKYGQTRIDLN